MLKLVKIDTMVPATHSPNCKYMAIVRSPKLVPIGWLHNPTLSPTLSLFYRYLDWQKKGLWTKETFEKEYVPQFIFALAADPKIEVELNSLVAYSHTDTDVYLGCFCGDESMCHRSIVGGILKGMGADIDCKEEYLKYYDMYKDIVSGF